MSLFDGEKIGTNTLVSQITKMTDEEINAKYRDGEIRIVTEQARYPLNTISSMVHSESYKMNPEYQRRHRWTNEKRSSLIESLIMNVPIPPIFLYEYEYSSYEVMDGLQRLTAISSFYDDDFCLEGLTRWPELNGKKYSELPKLIKQGVDRRYISSIILLHETAKTSEEAENLKQMVFDRINSGGEKLTAQEKRNANFDGRLNRLCIKLSENNDLCKTWGIPLEDGNPDKIHSKRAENKLFKTMGDVELVLRFFAYRQRMNLQRGSLESYLDFFLGKGNYFSIEVLGKFEEIFIESIKLAYELFGEKAFFLYRKRITGWGWFERATTVVYDPMMSSLSERLDDKDKLISKKLAINESIKDFYKDNQEFFEGRNTNQSALEERDSKFDEFFDGFI
ncbi:DUF262 domain-containing protein [Marinobacter sp. LV10MA510-1]|uniref:DUF262 domain-containing protein n=1 Tax=Marinobacter sp. LV10MA510-1 TaxID=1415567 RepID=UPI000BF32674|nr:DUF262 domain-containing protein [Marinobacter sp. LV10MA510-1]PFG11121.1 uncharacterized protein DUF262 [Marinobacter sp. LV10MA510-1]